MSLIRFAARVPEITPFEAAPSQDQVSLGGGYAYPDLLPDVTALAIQAAQEFRVPSLQYGPLMGLPELRDEIVKFLAADGVVTARENILVLNGAKNGLDIAMRLLVEKDNSIIVTRPNYATALHIFRGHEVSFIEIGLDEEGICLDELTTKLDTLKAQNKSLPRVLYIVPDFHNPAGVTMSEARRRRVVEMAEEYNFVILEDDPYRHVRFEGNRVPPIRAFDIHGRVITFGTVSKIFAPGIRIGWANASTEIIKRMSAMKVDGGTSPFSQRIVALAFQTGLIANHTRDLSVELRTHRDTMVEALRKHMPQARFRVPQGGYYIWIGLPTGINCDLLTKEAEKAGVTIFSGRGYFAHKDATNYIRLCFSNSTPARIECGVEILGEVLHRLHNGSGSSPSAIEPIETGHFD